MATDFPAVDRAAFDSAMAEAYKQQQDEQLQDELDELRSRVQSYETRLDSLNIQNAQLRRQIDNNRCADCAEIAEAVDAELNDDDIDAMMRTANDAMVRQLNDVIDVDAGLSAILTRHEEA